jgi:hypothetical protein
MDKGKSNSMTQKWIILKIKITLYRKGVKNNVNLFLHCLIQSSYEGTSYTL